MQKKSTAKRKIFIVIYGNEENEIAFDIDKVFYSKKKAIKYINKFPDALGIFKIIESYISIKEVVNANSINFTMDT